MIASMLVALVQAALAEAAVAPEVAVPIARRPATPAPTKNLATRLISTLPLLEDSCSLATLSAAHGCSPGRQSHGDHARTGGNVSRASGAALPRVPGRRGVSDRADHRLLRRSRAAARNTE